MTHVPDPGLPGGRPRKRRIDVQTLKDLLFDDYAGADWSVLEDKVTGTWRWGIHKTVILSCASVEEGGAATTWGYDYEVQTSNEDYILSFAEDSEVELWKAVPVTVVNWKEDK